MKAPAIPPAPAPIRARSKTDRCLRTALGAAIDVDFVGFWSLSSIDMEVERKWGQLMGFVLQL